MRIVVTGGSGAIGSFVTCELRDNGHDVTVFDIANPEISGVDYKSGDITDSDNAEASLEQADAIVHLAALLPTACRESPQRANRVNVGGTLNIFDAAIDRDICVIYASSKAVIGAITGEKAHPTYEPIGEDIARNPTSVYGITKLACEQYAKQYRANGLDVVGLRFASTFGPGKREAHGTLAYLPELIRRAAAGDHLTIDGGDQANDLIYYRDIAQAIQSALTESELTHHVYHIGSGQACEIQAFADILEWQTNATIEVTDGLDYRNTDTASYYRLDISRAVADFGYEPKYGPEEAVEDFFAHLESVEI